MHVESGDYGDYLRLLNATQIIDTRYPVKGCYVFLPDGFDIKDRVFTTAEKSLDRLGYRRYQFPRLVSGDSIRLVTEGVANFEDGLYWLRRRDGEELDLFLTPTGETGVYTMFREWIKQSSDLPLRMYQIGQTFRPHKRPNVLLNGEESMNLLEAHSAFATAEESAVEFNSIVDEFRDLHQTLGIPAIAMSRPIEGNKPVALNMVSFESYLPSKKTSFNVGVIYNQDTIYSKPMNVAFTDEKSVRYFTHQITFGISDRAVAVMLDLHRDKHGLKLLSEFAPIQVAFFPVVNGDSRDNEVIDATHALSAQLGDLRTCVVHSKERIGKAMAKMRERGVPLRIGISKDNIDLQTVRVYLRTHDDPRDIKIENLSGQIRELLGEVDNDIRTQAEELFKSKFVDVTSVTQLPDLMDARIIARCYCCDNQECRHIASESAPGEIIGSDFYSVEAGQCFVCSKPAPLSYFSRRNATP